MAVFITPRIRVDGVSDGKTSPQSQAVYAAWRLRDTRPAISFFPLSLSTQRHRLCSLAHRPRCRPHVLDRCDNQTAVGNCGVINVIKRPWLSVSPHELRTRGTKTVPAIYLLTRSGSARTPRCRLSAHSIKGPSSPLSFSSFPPTLIL
jgi:hypothetical protein